MKKKLTLDVAISTYRPEGINRVAAMNLPKIDRVRYVVSWQLHGGAEIPDELKERDDVSIFRFDKAGQSNNRNNSIDRTSADIVLIGDDDLTYYQDGLKEILRIYEENEDIDFATFICMHNSLRIMPSSETILKLPLPKGYCVGAWELSFRRKTILDKGIKFHPLLGLNSPSMHSGEDEFFLICAIKKGLRCKFFPVKICEHPHESTGTKAKMTAANVRGGGCIIALSYPLWSVAPRIVLKAWRLSRSGRYPFFPALCVLLQGVFLSPKVRRDMLN